LSLINNTLDYSKIEAGEVSKVELKFSIRAIFKKLQAIFSLQAIEKGLDFSIDIPETFPDSLVGDPLRIEQVLLNLCGNAFKFTPEGSVNVSVCLKHRGPTDIGVEFLVSDTGIGIPEESIGHLFDAFKQADSSTTRNFGGTGLGLTISKQVVDIMGGHLTVSSTVGKGSQFSMYLNLQRAESVHGDDTMGPNNTGSSELAGVSNVTKPISGAEPAASAGEAIEGYDTNSSDCKPSTDLLASVKLLLVEDIPFNQTVAEMMLEDAGALVTIVENGLEAVKKLEAESDFDVVLMDIQMPVMDGYEATEIILANSKLSHIPIIAMTANALEEDIEKCSNAGMVAHISKPVDEDLMIRIVADQVKLKQNANIQSA